MAVWFRRMLHQGQIQAHILLWQIVYKKKKIFAFLKMWFGGNVGGRGCCCSQWNQLFCSHTPASPCAPGMLWWSSSWLPSCTSLFTAHSKPQWLEESRQWYPYKIFFLIYLFIIIIWLLWVFVAVCRFSLVVEGGSIFCCSAWTSYSGGFPCCGAEVLGRQASGVVARGLSSCGTWAWLLQGVWNLPGPGIEPAFSALACGFLFTVRAYQFEEWVHTVLFWFFLVMDRDFPSTSIIFHLIVSWCKISNGKEPWGWKLWLFPGVCS